MPLSRDGDLVVTQTSTNDDVNGREEFESQVTHSLPKVRKPWTLLRNLHSNSEKSTPEQAEEYLEETRVFVGREEMPAHARRMLRKNRIKSLRGD